MGIITTLFPTPGKILFMILLFPLVALLILAVFGFTLALTTFSLTFTLIISVVISYVLVSIVYQFVKAAVKVLVAIVLVGFLLSYFGVAINPTPFNNFLNDKFNELDQSCEVDTDCAVKQISCDGCAGIFTPYDAVNAEWDPWCPVWANKSICSLDPFNVPSLNTTCINNQCQIEDES